MDNYLKILLFLAKNREQKFTMHEISNLTKIPYATFFRTVQRMKNLIDFTKIGKATVIDLKENNLALNSHLSVASFQETEDYLEKNPIFKKISSELQKGIYSVLLFGSFAKGMQNSKSDIDLLIINKNGEKNLNFSKYETIFSKEINPIFVSEKEFKIMLSEKEENLGKQALKANVILHNPDYFWRLVFNGV